MMKPCRYEYSKFQDLDIFLSHCDNPIGRIIKIATLMKINPFDEKTPTHGGFITKTYGRFFASEMKPRFTENSLKKYTGRFEQIVEVWRCKGLAEEPIRTKVRFHLSRLHEKQKCYDLSGAILSSKLGRMTLGKLPWFKNNPEDDFCTEMNADTLRMFIDPKCPKAPSPLDLSKYFRSNPIYQMVEGYKVIL